jgi:hypothetical protein
MLPFEMVLLYLNWTDIMFSQPRPTIYNVVMEMTKRMGYEVRLR